MSRRSYTSGGHSLTIRHLAHAIRACLSLEEASGTGCWLLFPGVRLFADRWATVELRAYRGRYRPFPLLGSILGHDFVMGVLDETMLDGSSLGGRRSSGNLQERDVSSSWLF